jgi:outer membrane protein assembly factor BamA
VGSSTISTNSQVNLTLKTTAFAADERWRLEADYRLQWTSQEMFGLGMPPPLDSAQLARFDYLRLYQALYREVRPFLHVGGGVYIDRHADVRPDDENDPQWPSSPYVEYSTANGLPLEAQTSVGPGVEMVWDSRDNFINPDHGVLARGGYKVLINDFLGGDSTWGRVNLDLRAYRHLPRRSPHKIAMWVYADLVAHGTAPYFHLPSTANDTYTRSGRGYAEGHFRGEKLAFTELEYRAPLTANGLLGMVVFANATSVADTSKGQALFDRVAPGGGAGLRLLMNKRSKTNIAFDVGFGERGNRGIYLAIQEAF